jgi:hypothetical protein
MMQGARPRVQAEPLPARPAAAAPRRSEAPQGMLRPAMQGAIKANYSNRLPQGMGKATRPDSIFHGSGDAQQIQAASSSDPRLGPVQLASGIRTVRRDAVPTRMLGQASPAAASGAVGDYPSIDRLLDKQITGVSFTRAEAGALKDALEAALVRVGSPENASAGCVKTLGPGTVEKAAVLKAKLAAFQASADDSFKDFSASELEGADKVLSCAGVLTQAAQNSGNALAWILLIAVSAAVAYTVQKSMKKKGS